VIIEITQGKKMHLVGPYYTTISWCTVHRMSNFIWS